MIGFGVLIKVGIVGSYGVLLGDEEIVGVCKVLGWDYVLFVIFDEVYENWCVVGLLEVYDVWCDCFVFMDKVDELVVQFLGELGEVGFEVFVVWCK